MIHDIKYGKNQKKTFLEVLAATCNVAEAAKATGTLRHYWYRIRKKDKEFAQAWENAVEAGADALEAEARRRAHDGFLEPVFYQGKKVGKIRRYSDTLLIFLLKGYRPDKFHDTHRVEGGDKPIKIEIVKFADNKNTEQVAAPAGSDEPMEVPGKRRKTSR